MWGPYPLQRTSFPRRREPSTQNSVGSRAGRNAEAAVRLYPGQQAQCTPYIGATSDLPQRTSLHKQDLIEGFTKRYGVHRVVYYEMHHTMPEAILREKRLKKWNRAWKIRLIESMNPSFAARLPKAAAIAWRCDLGSRRRGEDVCGAGNAIHWHHDAEASTTLGRNAVALTPRACPCGGSSPSRSRR